MCESRSLIDDSWLLNTAHDQDDHDDDHSIFLNNPTAISVTYGISYYWGKGIKTILIDDSWLLDTAQDQPAPFHPPNPLRGATKEAKKGANGQDFI